MTLSMASRDASLSEQDFSVAGAKFVRRFKEENGKFSEFVLPGQPNAQNLQSFLSAISEETGAALDFSKESVTGEKAWHLAFELALEEALFALELSTEESILQLWQSEPAVVVGQYQNVFAETCPEFLQDRGIPLLRRCTGGGTVYHDQGTLCFSLLQKMPTQKSVDQVYGEAVDTVVKALQALGMAATQGKRHEILCHQQKISGTACKNARGKILTHGTLLFATDLKMLDAVTGNPSDAIESKAIASVPSQVMNIKQFLPRDADIVSFGEKLSKAIRTVISKSKVLSTLSCCKKALVASSETITSETITSETITSETMTSDTASHSKLKELSEVAVCEILPRILHDTYIFGRNPQFKVKVMLPLKFDMATKAQKLVFSLTVKHNQIVDIKREKLPSIADPTSPAGGLRSQSVLALPSQSADQNFEAQIEDVCNTLQHTLAGLFYTPQELLKAAKALHMATGLLSADTWYNCLRGQQ